MNNPERTECVCMCVYSLYIRAGGNNVLNYAVNISCLKVEYGRVISSNR